MQEVFSVYLQNSLQLSAIILLMLLISPILSHRYSAKCRYYLWTVVFAALLLPIRANIKLTLPEFLQAVVPQDASKAVAAFAAANNTAGWDWLPYAGLLWIVGSAIFIGWHLFSHLRFLSAVTRWSEAVKDADILRIFDNTKNELRINKYVPIKSCACIKTPMVVGFFRPVVLLPRVAFSLDELPLILKHELVHIKRNDLWYKVLMLSTLAIHWFNPVTHLAVRSALTLPVAPESREQPNQTMMDDTEPRYVDTTVPLDIPDMEQGDSENQSLNDNNFPPNALIRTYEYPAVEPSQKQTYKYFSEESDQARTYN